MADLLTALVIDDELSIRRLFQVALEDSGWEVTVAESAEEALGLLAANRFDALVVDKNLPHMSGVEVVRELRRTNEVTACVMITAFSSVESALTTMQLGIDAYIEKPFENVYVLVQHIGELVAKRRAQALKPSVAARALHVLLACADDVNRGRLRTWLEAQGDRVTTVDTLGRLENDLSELSPDALVIDEALPAPGLPEFLAHAGRQTRLPVTFVLAGETPTLGVLMNLISSEVRGVIQRPVVAAHLDERVGETLAKLRQSA